MITMVRTLNPGYCFSDPGGKEIGGEKRRHERYPVRQNLLLAFKSRPVRVGTVRDISRGGVSFDFVYVTPWAEEAGTREVELFDYNSDFCVENLCCRIAHECEIQSENISVMRCGLEFDGISGEQLEIIDEIIDRFASSTGEPANR